MVYAYFIENTGGEFKDNSCLFRYIKEQNISEDNIYIDTADNKDELDALLEKIEPGDNSIKNSNKFSRKEKWAITSIKETVRFWCIDT